MLEGEVDGDADKGRGEDDGADLGFKGFFVPRVGGEGDSGAVACGQISQSVSQLVLCRYCPFFAFS